MPKSIEHYQQETGRAGRDGLEAECVLLYSAADTLRWHSLINKGAVAIDSAPEFVNASRALIEAMRRFCAGLHCRHRRLAEYFGQSYNKVSCEACDVCLNEVEGAADATLTAQKILSCVARAGERFGAEHIIDVLLGAKTERIRRWEHDQLSTYGSMRNSSRPALLNVIYQLIDDGLLERSADQRPILRLNAAAHEVMQGRRAVRLLAAKAKVKKPRIDEDSWANVDNGLFEVLRQLRRQLAQQRGVPAYVLFNDVTLRAMARTRPGSPNALLEIRGVGERKLEEVGQRFLEAIANYCREHRLPLDV